MDLYLSLFHQRAKGKHSFWLALSLLLPILAVDLFLPQLVRSQTKQAARCSTETARLFIGGDKNFREGTLLCPEDLVVSIPGKRPRLLCLNNGRVMVGQTGRVGDLCAGKPQNQIVCDKKGCSRPSRGNEGKPSVIKPFGPTLIDRRPDLTWVPTKGATHYQVRLKGHQFEQEQTISGTHLKYPKAWPSLEFENVYHVDIFAYQGGTIISADRATVNVLFEEEAVAIQENANAIKQLPYPLHKVAVDLDALYMSQNLLNQSIQLLEGLRKKGESNPRLDKILAKRYLQAGYPDLAKSLRGAD